MDKNVQSKQPVIKIKNAAPRSVMTSIRRTVIGTVMLSAFGLLATLVTGGKARSHPLYSNEALPITSESLANLTQEENEHPSVIPCPDNSTRIDGIDTPIRAGSICIESSLSFNEAVFGTLFTVTVERTLPTEDGTLRFGTSTFEITVPAGVVNGTRIRIEGEGNANSSGSLGDLYVSFLVPYTNGLFRREDNDIFSTLFITAKQASSGDSIAVPTVDGSTSSLQIPPGTRGGDNFTLLGEGVPVLFSSPEQRGDHVVTIEIKP